MKRKEIGQCKKDMRTWNEKDKDFARGDQWTKSQQKAMMRTFDTGATRHSDVDKLDIEGFLSPIVLTRYCEYLHKHRKQADGKLRDSDNWQKGIGKDVYMKSLLRHVMAMWTHHRGFPLQTEMEEDICGAIFNLMGYLFEIEKEKIPHNAPNASENPYVASVIKCTREK